MHDPMIATKFPCDLEPLWGRKVKAKAYVTYRTVIEIPNKKTGKNVRMPLLETIDLQIDGYDKTIPKVVLMSPAFWKSGIRTMDTVEFSGVLIKEKSQYVGFRLICQVTAYNPFSLNSYITSQPN